jgi:mono/diheme cytochrome c family protein
MKGSLDLVDGSPPGALSIFQVMTCQHLFRSRRAAAAVVALALALLVVACDRGGYDIDPAVAERPLPERGAPLDTALVRVGARIYQERCVACHKLDAGIAVGPNLHDVTDRREPEWIRGMVLNPDSMLRTDSLARALLREYRVPMIDPGIGEPEFRAVLEFLRAQAPAGPS